MRLNGQMAREWEHVRYKMKLSGVFRVVERGEIAWMGKMKEGGHMVVDTYFSLYHQETLHPKVCWFTIFWKSNSPIRIILFLWLVWKIKNLTWENLQKRHWYGPGFCVICKAAYENNLHLFIICPNIIQLWKKLVVYTGFP